MNRVRFLALGIVSLVFAFVLISSVAAASIVRSGSGTSPAPSYVVAYPAESSGCDSTIVRSYNACTRRPTYKETQPRSSFNSGATRRYAESPGEERYPRASQRTTGNMKAVATNFDTTNYDYDYRGPLYERRIISSDDFLHENSARSGFFSSKHKDITTRSVRNEVVEKYIGASESMHAGTQNNRVAMQEGNSNQAYDYDGGFSFGKQRLFDESEYSSASSSGNGNYYYRPYYDPARQIYNWRY